MPLLTRPTLTRLAAAAVLAAAGAACAMVESLNGVVRGSYQQQDDETAPDRGPHAVGYRVVDLPGCVDSPHPEAAKGTDTLTVAVWYPTTADEAAIIYDGDKDDGRVTGSVARDAPLSKGAWPMLVFSHGYGGGGIASTFFTERLASMGWIVVCPDHHDADQAIRIRTGFDTDLNMMKFGWNVLNLGADFQIDDYAYRLDEFARAMDWALQDQALQEGIDPARIAVGGHSLGGFTSLAAAGAVGGRRDKRAKALLLFAPALWMYDESDWARVEVPVMVMFGQTELWLKRGADDALGHSQGPHYYVEIRRGGHTSFNDRFRRGDPRGLWSGTDTQMDVIADYAIAFLERHVNETGESMTTLARLDDRLSRFDAVAPR